MWLLIRYGPTLLVGIFVGRFILPKFTISERWKEMLWARWGWG